MNLQYISDSKGKTTGVFIPIKDWNKIKEKYVEIDQSLDDNWYDLLSEKDKKNIEISLQQADNCNTIPHRVVSKKIKDKISKLKNS